MLKMRSSIDLYEKGNLQIEPMYLISHPRDFAANNLEGFEYTVDDGDLFVNLSVYPIDDDTDNVLDYGQGITYDDVEILSRGIVYEYRKSPSYRMDFVYFDEYGVQYHQAVMFTMVDGSILELRAVAEVYDWDNYSGERLEV